MIKYLFLRLLEKLNILDKINFSICINLNEKKIKIPILKGIGLYNIKVTEKWLIKLFSEISTLKGGSFIDVGANLGQTLIKIKSVNLGIRYIGLEPNPICVSYLIELIKKNKFKNCEILPVGLSNKNSLVKLNCYHGDTDSSASILEGFRKAKINQSFWVSTFNFESIYELLDIEKISIVKIDVEGAELEVIKGMEEIFVQHRPFIFCEILPVYDKKKIFRLNRQKEIEHIIKKLKYRIFRILKEDKLVLLEQIGIHSNLDLCNYLFIPSDFLSEIPKDLNIL